ncbi:DUF6090 family protein [Psychroserpens jangbogonensis]|uniref:DUF6090 family protein n=1 Tax=Psychroserpens jangbogonensis TaxID=1484460 RepID=UPI00068CDF34|nr:DUF6090 family protein [Psychroserpens jangbogonensis]
MKKNKTGKYLKYAIGEIVLVVIGILIALQINNWNNQNLLHKKELNYLVEISKNLNEDLKKIEEVLEFNVEKSRVINEALVLLGNPMDEKVRINNFVEYMPILSSYESFIPIKISFDNMISSQSIDLITNNKLKKLLSEYYSFDFYGGTQEQVKILTRKFGNDIMPFIFVKQVVDPLLNMDSQLPTIESVNFQSNSIVFGDLFTTLKSIEGQNQLLIQTKSDINVLIKTIN